MTDHLAECGYSPGKRGWGSINGGVPQKYVQPSPCICDRLRACEQRVLDAAREAILHDEYCLSNLDDADERDCDCARPYAVAAIDALREKR